jgi:hypothetical protein
VKTCPDPFPPRRPFRRRRFAAPLCLAAACALGGCGVLAPAASAPPAPEAAYPAPVAGFARWDRFPAEVAGYRRGAVLRYAPGMTDYSIAYQRRDPPLDADVTLYFYPRMNDGAAQIAREEAEVQQEHPGARIVERHGLPLSRNGAVYIARLVSFEYEDMFAGRRQRVCMQLLVAFRALGTFKATSVAPWTQAQEAQRGFQQLLDNVAWEAPGDIDIF